MNRKSLLASLLIFSLFAALTFEAFHAGHEEHCHDEDCAICLVLQIIHNTNKIGKSSDIVTGEFIFFHFFNIVIFSALLLAPTTLVKQKVKLVI